MKLSFFSAFALSLVSFSVAHAIDSTNAAGTAVKDDGYRVPVYEGVEFEAELTGDGSVYMAWSPFGERDNDQFMYYKVMRSYGNSNPVYPEDPAIAFKQGLGDTRHIDKHIGKSAYYRVCVITEAKGRYCSNVVWIEIGEDQRQEHHDKLNEENKERQERHEEAWEEQKKEKEAATQAAVKKSTSDRKFSANSSRIDKHKSKAQMLTEKAKSGREEFKKRMESTDKDEEMEARMEAAFKKVQPKLDKFLDRVETVLVDSDKHNSEQKITKLKKLQERFYKWKKGNKFKIMVVEYLDKSFNAWIDQLSQDFDVNDIDSMLDGLFE